jgi:hypothetical protein
VPPRVANPRQSHACGRYTLAPHFKGKSPPIRRLFNAVRAEIRRIGPVRVLPEKTRVRADAALYDAA